MGPEIAPRRWPAVKTRSRFRDRTNGTPVYSHCSVLYYPLRLNSFTVFHSRNILYLSLLPHTGFGPRGKCFITSLLFSVYFKYYSSVEKHVFFLCTCVVVGIFYMKIFLIPSQNISCSSWFAEWLPRSKWQLMRHEPNTSRTCTPWRL